MKQGTMHSVIVLQKRCKLGEKKICKKRQMIEVSG